MSGHKVDATELTEHLTGWWDKLQLDLLEEVIKADKKLAEERRRTLLAEVAEMRLDPARWRQLREELLRSEETVKLVEGARDDAAAQSARNIKLGGSAVAVECTGSGSTGGSE